MKLDDLKRRKIKHKVKGDVVHFTVGDVEGSARIGPDGELDLVPLRSAAHRLLAGT